MCVNAYFIGLKYRGWSASFPNCKNYRCSPQLTKGSAADILQRRRIDTTRFLNKPGQVSAEKIEEIAVTIAAVVEYLQV